jgi:hypothetical protein
MIPKERNNFAQNQKFQEMIARNTVKIRRANNGYVINSEEGMQVATTLEDVKTFLDKKFGKTLDLK